ncbi:deoxyribodipyrimidine photolyase [Ketogulonicigenium robustum]|uniref:Deoxyribodipyrimidine photolyase n=1 Tax=Ketogulonicigenium robustum TaxID=92947 RepID=A0A1W6NZJ8_9RHOB|nr:deoxyribodipyrimidine photo-lyase [Ketogulonicigenium robustum]ARO14675.1 deoxyribodipyrimidine photolyase [Ketogulonicigenium robustum]
MTAPGVFWLTRDFRFADNAALAAACIDGPLLAVFLLDPVTLAQGAASRWRLMQALRAFDAALRRRTGGVGVTVLSGAPEDVFPPLLQQTGARRIHQSDWPVPQMQAQQQRLRGALAPLNGALHLHGGHLLTHPHRVMTQQGTPFRVFTPFARALRRLGPDRPGPDAPPRITASTTGPAGISLDSVNLSPDMHSGASVLEHYALPSGEDAALARLEAFFTRAAPYSSARDRPDIDATSGMSEHLASGEISPRRLWAITALRAEAEPALAGALHTFLSEVIWREFAWHLLLAFPQMPRAEWRGEWADFPWRGANSGFTAWQQARTGIGLVDAGLREMRVTGRMHNRVRMVVASWLTKHLLTDWRLGLAHFADSLTDWDPAANAMNWQWVAGCGPDASPYFRIFNPEKQAAQFDPDGTYRAKWLAGWNATTAPHAAAYYDTLPSSWQVPQPWVADGDAQRLSAGRNAALAAYSAFKSNDASPRFEGL